MRKEGTLPDSWQDFAQVRELGDPDSDTDEVLEKKKRIFNQFYEELMPCCAGKQEWQPIHWVHSTISKGNIVTITDEAFVSLSIENYWDCWMADSKSHNNKYTNNRSGHKQYQGWNAAGLNRFNVLCGYVASSRASDKGKEAENAFLLYARIKYGNDGKLGKRKGIPTYDFSVFDEVDTLLGDSNGFQRGQTKVSTNQ